jgi:gamma-glutamylcyclotransferase (GGCT)/AIG2-like uncharacterized protein YtfP
MSHGAGHITAADAEVRLASYGSLAPGQRNHHQLAGLKGTWAPGTVRGRLHDAGWGARMGYPALVLDPNGSAVAVQIFTSTDLPDHWDRLDAFEGAGYRRVVVSVLTRAGAVEASIYVLV